MNKLFRQISRQAFSLVSACSMFLGLAHSAQAFVHPGIPFTTEDINQLKANINTAPWSTGYAAFAADSHSQLGYGMQGPFATVGRAADVNLSQFNNDMQAIHNLTWMWIFTGNAAYAQKATDMLDAWAVTNTKWTGDETFLALGDDAEWVVTAADILKSRYPGWTAANTSHVNNWFANVLWPQAEVPNPVRGANQGAIELKLALSLAAFLDDTTRWNQALSALRTDAAGGLANTLPNGEVGDSGRDDGHWRGQIVALAWCAEVAWKQGVDVYGDLDNRLLAASELYSRWQISTTGLTYIPFGGGYGFFGGSFGNAGGSRPAAHFYNIIQGAYAVRKGIPAPYTVQLRDLSPDSLTAFLFRKSADNSTAVLLPPVVHPTAVPVTNLTDSDVGAACLAGSANFDSGTGIWTVKGAGADIPVPPLTAPDAFNFAFQQVTGDAVIVAHVTSKDSLDPNAKAGVMFRESLAADAKYVGVFLQPSMGAVATWRGATGFTRTNASWFNPPGGFQSHGVSGVPYWLKLERLGTRLYAYHSFDGISWTCVSVVEIPVANTAYFGLCVTSHNTSALNTATFDNVAITSSAPAGSPVITSSTSASATAGATFSYVLTASNAPTSYSATGLPGGISIDSGTGVISGAPATPGTSYVNVSATNGNGTGMATLILTVYSDVAPAAPTGLTATDVGGTTASLSWTASTNASSYIVKRALTTGGPYTTVVSGVTGTSFLDASPYSGANYYVVTALAGSLESAASSEASVVLPPAIPLTAPTVINGNGQVTLSWPAATGASGYNIKRGTVRGGPYTTVAAGVAVPNYTDTGLTNGTYYYYVISSVSGALESANSAEELGVPGAITSQWRAAPISGNWNTEANWSSKPVPPNPSILSFDASTTTTLNNNLISLPVARITFNAAAPSYTISGNAIAVGNDITNNSTVSQTIATAATLTGSLALNATAGELTLSGVISGSGSIVKNGFNRVTFANAASTYSGGTTLTGASGGWGPTYVLRIAGVGTGAAGAPTAGPVGVGPLYLNGGSLYSSGATIYNNVVAVPGPKSKIVNEGGDLLLSGNISGGGSLEYDGSIGGSTQLRGDNSGFTGTFTIVNRSSAARFHFTTPTAGSAAANWVFNSTFPDCPRLAYSGTMSLGSLSGSGTMRSLGGGPGLSIGALNTDSEYSGGSSGDISITKVGTGTFTLSGLNSYSGATTVNAGTLLVNGSITSPVTVNSGAFFGGAGTSSAAVTVNTGATLTPGSRGIGSFTTTGPLTLNAGSTCAIELSSTDSLADKITAKGVTLTGSPLLTLADIAPGTLPMGATFTLVDNTGSSPVVGTFSGLPEGSVVTVGAYPFILTYQGGDGNNIELHDQRTASLPGAVAGLSATAVNSFQIDLSWATAPLSDSVMSYSVKRATTAGGPYTTVANVNNPNYSDTSLNYSTTYYYVVTANNFVGSSALSAEVSATTLAPVVPPAPGGVIVAVGDGKITLSWSAVSGATGYEIKRASVPGGPYTTIASGLTAVAYTDASVVNGTAYYYIVTATNASGSSVNSIEVGGTPATGGFSYWPLNETGGATAADVWGTRNATLAGAGATWVSGVSGNGLRLDGAATSYASLPAGIASTLSGDFTISAWVKFDALQNNQRLFDFGFSTDVNMFIAENNPTTIRYAIKTGANSEQGINATIPTLVVGKWVHVTITRTDSTNTHTLYVNGMAAATTTTGIDAAHKPSALGNTPNNYFGKSQWPDPLLKGTVDDFRIYRRALSAAEVAGLVNAVAPDAPTNLIGTLDGSSKPVLNWTASPEATAYIIKRATVAGGPYTAVASGVAVTTYSDATAPGGTFYYIVAPIARSFEGVPSNEISVTVPTIVVAPGAIPATPPPLATGWNARINLNWAPAASATSYIIKRAPALEGPFTQIAEVATTTAPTLIYNDTGLINGTTYYYTVAAKNSSGLSADSAPFSATPVNNPEAEIWTHTDVGAVGFSGNASYSGGTYTVYGSGADIWTTADSFQFLYQPLIGDGGIMARITNQSTVAETGGSAKAGVMIRNNLTAANSLNATMDRTPNSVVEFIRRSVTTTNAVATTASGATLPRWVRLVRTGNIFTAYQSPDGVTWTNMLAGGATIAMGTNTSIGLVFCANNNTKRGQAMFDHVSIAKVAPVITSGTTATGAVGIPFSFTITASNSPAVYGARNLPAGLSVDPDTGVISGTPTSGGPFNISIKAVNAFDESPEVSVTGTLSQGTAVVALDNLSQGYDGTVKLPTFTTTPPGLKGLYQINGLPVVITLPEGFLTDYAPLAGQTLYVAATGATYGVAYGTNAAGFALSSDLDTAAVHAGLLAPGQTAVLKVSILSDVGSYTGTTANGVTTFASGASVGSFKIVGIADPAEYTLGPITPGSYNVKVTLFGAYAGEITGTLVITQYSPTITWNAPSAITYGTALNATQLNATADTSGSFVYTPVAGAVLDAGTNQTLSVTFTPTDAVKYTAASATTTIDVSPATATVTLGNLAQTYDGSPKSATATTTPSSLSVVFTYDGNSTAPINAGSYAVEGVVNDANHAGSATGTLVIGKAAATVSIGALNQTYDGSPKQASVTTSPAGLPVIVTYNGSSTPPINAGSYAVSAIVDDPNYAGSSTGTLVIGKAGALVTLGALNQRYDGTPRIVTATTSPANLTVNLTYNGSVTAPTYPGSYVVVATIDDPDYSGAVSSTLVVTTTVLVRHAPLMNSDVDGSLQQLLTENTTLNNGAMISGDLLVPGTPAVQLYGAPTFGGTINGTGSASPTNYTITLNGSALLRHLVRRIDPITMPVVTAPPAPTGTRDVTLSSASQSIGNFATLRNLTLNNGAGVRAISPGTYGAFVLNGTSGITLGIAGATEPAIYNVQNLTINTQSGYTALQIVGPVILTLANGTQISAQAGAAAHPEWLTLRIASGGFTINGSVTFNGSVIAPNGTVTLNSTAKLNGTVAADRLTLNGTSLVNDPNQ